MKKMRHMVWTKLSLGNKLLRLKSRPLGLRLSQVRWTCTWFPGSLDQVLGDCIALLKNTFHSVAPSEGKFPFWYKRLILLIFWRLCHIALFALLCYCCCTQKQRQRNSCAHLQVMELSIGIKVITVYGYYVSFKSRLVQCFVRQINFLKTNELVKPWKNNLKFV